LAKEIEGSLTVGNNKVCFDRRGRKNKCSNNEKSGEINTMDIDRGRNCYSCGGFGHITCYCRNRRIIGKGRRITYEQTDNLKEEENLESLN